MKAISTIKYRAYWCGTLAVLLGGLASAHVPQIAVAQMPVPEREKVQASADLVGQIIAEIERQPSALKNLDPCDREIGTKVQALRVQIASWQDAAKLSMQQFEGWITAQRRRLLSSGAETPAEFVDATLGHYRALERQLEIARTRLIDDEMRLQTLVDALADRNALFHLEQSCSKKP